MGSDNKIPEVCILSGYLHQLRMDTTQNTEGNRTRIFHFTTGRHHCIFYAATFLGSGNVFLAEGDHVELVVPDISNSDQEEIPVYAMRNLEDGDVYVSHSLSGWRSDLKGIPRLSLRQQRNLMMQFGVVLVVVWFIFGIAWRTFDPGGDASRRLFYGASAILPTTWIVPAAIMGWYWLRWKFGMPTQRQRLQEKVYAALSLGSPLEAPSGVYDV
jgi:hypothetical protein